MPSFALFRVPGTAVDLPDLKDLGLQGPELIGFGIILGVPLLAATLVLIVNYIHRHRHTRPPKPVRRKHRPN